MVVSTYTRKQRKETTICSTYTKPLHLAITISPIGRITIVKVIFGFSITIMQGSASHQAVEIRQTSFAYTDDGFEF